MRAEIVCIGTELLLGDTINTNATWLAKQLKELGVDLYYVSTIGDNRLRIEEVLKTAYSRSDLILITGGLGPTEDDLTREMISLVTERPLVFHQDLAEGIEERFRHFKRPMTASNLRQAYLPEGAQPIINRAGTAPGVYLKTEQAIFIALPGVPREMKINFSEEALPKLKEELPAEEVIFSRLLRMCGIGESTMEDKVKDLIQNQTTPTIAPYAGQNEVYLKVTVKAPNREKGQEMMKEMITELYQRLSPYIYGEDEETLELVIGRILRKKKLLLVLAESCTGGLISHRLTNIPGSSAYIDRSFVTYSNRAKIQQLGISAEIIERSGAVSRETAKAMVKGALANSDAQIGLAVTGIAGPGGGTPKKPVGLVYCAIGNHSGRLIVNEFNLTGQREWIKFSASQYALYYLWKFIQDE